MEDCREMMSGDRDKLPEVYESRYNSEMLKEHIADDGMWFLIPGIHGGMDSREGIQRLKENDLLFRFIDSFFPEGPFAFEPNMQDGRFVFLPENVCHQGVGICASKDLPGFLEVGHFWYPCEFTEKTISFGPGQVYVPMFSAKPEQLVEMVKKTYIENKEPDYISYCTFPFNPDVIVTLEGSFLDKMSQSVKHIRTVLRNEAPQIKRNGEGLIQFMKSVMD